MEPFMKCLKKANNFSTDLINHIIDYLICEKSQKELMLSEILKYHVNLEYSYSWISDLDELSEEEGYSEFVDVIFHLLSDADKLIVFRTYNSTTKYSNQFKALSPLHQAKILVLTLSKCSLTTFTDDLNLLIALPNPDDIYNHDWNTLEKIIISLAFSLRKDTNDQYDFIETLKNLLRNAIEESSDDTIKSLLTFDAKTQAVTAPICTAARKILGENVGLLLAYTIAGKDDWLDNFCIIGLTMSYRLRHLTIDTKNQNFNSIFSKIPTIFESLTTLSNSTPANKTAIVMYHYPKNMYPPAEELDAQWFSTFMAHNLRIAEYTDFLTGKTDLSAITPEILNKSSYTYIYNDILVMPHYFEELLKTYKTIFGKNDVYHRLLVIRLLSKCCSIGDLEGIHLLEQYNLSADSIAWYFSYVHPISCKHSQLATDKLPRNVTTLIHLISSQEEILGKILATDTNFVQEKKLVLVLAIRKASIQYNDAKWAEILLALN
ncbi:hypothetical protein [Candidatus Epulonipiscium viviparus]|uniref:hypothetical protein n=1 Tax=Candidatus Epulonipiscium viviparus TaxID=420336 RepID=UPI002738165C|nr:hypothetical protein [Candidatus Epulopiscium viviparus]